MTSRWREELRTSYFKPTTCKNTARGILKTSGKWKYFTTGDGDEKKKIVKIVYEKSSTEEEEFNVETKDINLLEIYHLQNAESSKIYYVTTIISGAVVTLSYFRFNPVFNVVNIVFNLLEGLYYFGVGVHEKLSPIIAKLKHGADYEINDIALDVVSETVSPWMKSLFSFLKAVFVALSLASSLKIFNEPSCSEAFSKVEKLFENEIVTIKQIHEVLKKIGFTMENLNLILNICKKYFKNLIILNENIEVNEGGSLGGIFLGALGILGFFNPLSWNDKGFAALKFTCTSKEFVDSNKAIWATIELGTSYITLRIGRKIEEILILKSDESKRNNISTVTKGLAKLNPPQTLADIIDWVYNSGQLERPFNSSSRTGHHFCMELAQKFAEEPERFTLQSSPKTLYEFVEKRIFHYFSQSSS